MSPVEYRRRYFRQLTYLARFILRELRPGSRKVPADLRVALLSHAEHYAKNPPQWEPEV